MSTNIHLGMFFAAMLSISSCGGGSSGVSSRVIEMPPSPPPAANGNVVLMGGIISTMNTQNDNAEALAFDEAGKIIAVGSLASVQAAAGEAAETIDLKGAQVLPGFQDVHLHAVEAGINENRCILTEFGTVTQYQSEIMECAVDQAESPWFIGAGVSMPDLLALTQRPIDLLDELIPDKPALILDNLGHGAWANTLAMESVGYDQLEQDPPGGLIDVDSMDELSGVVYENAQQALRDAALPANATNAQANYDGLKLALNVLAENGITSVSDAGGYWTRGHHETWVKAEADNLLTVRASNALYVFPDREMEQQIADIRALKSRGKYVRFDQVKIYVDGIITQGTATLKAPYTNSPDIADVSPSGFEYFDRDELMEYAKQFDALGFSLHFHATGDKGVSLALDAIEGARTANGDSGNRHRVTHLFMVDSADVPRFAALEVTADIQATPTSIDPETITFYSTLIGERANAVIPVSSLLNSGANVTMSSDWDADELNPLIKIEQAVDRSSGQAIPDVVTALRMMTINPAKLLGHDDITGSLEVGKQADLVILDRNILTIPTDQIDESKVLVTVFDGETIYDPNGIFE